MKIAVLGDGAIGTLLAAYLARSGADTSLICKNKERSDRIKRKGIKVIAPRGNWSVRLKAISSSKKIDKIDLFILAVKAYDTVKVCKRIKALVDKDTVILTLQNGLGNIESISSVFPCRKILAGTTTMGATLLSTGKVYLAGKGEIFIGVTDKRIDGDEMNRIIKSFNRAGIKAKVTNDLNSLLWGKLVLNCAINPLAALTGKRNGEIIKDKGLVDIMRMIVEEVKAVAKKRKISLPYSRPFERVISACRATPRNMNSMLQDVMKGKKTEIDFLNGRVVREGKKADISTPINRTLWLLVKGMERESE